MKSKTEKLVAVLSAVTLLAACAEMTPLQRRSAGDQVASKNANKQTDHDRLAKQYENTAKQLLAKAEEQKKLLQHYEEKSYLYGRQAQDNQSHAVALLNRYQHDATETLKQAAFHQRMAAEMAQRDQAMRQSKAEARVTAEQILELGG
jgi:hypothetical protein